MPTPKIQELFTSMHAVLGIYLTNKCNMRCRHCSVLSGPEEDSRVPVEQILGDLKEFALLPLAKGIHISGGEPFLYPDDIAQIAAVGQASGLAVAVATNGSWATSQRKAQQILAKAPGLTQLLLSTDTFHQEFAPIERVVFAAKAGIERDLHVTINVCSHNENPEEIEILDRLLGDVRERVDVAVSAIEQVGRATHLAVANWRGDSAEYPNGSCRQINRPVIMEDKRLLACCNTTVADTVRNSPLDGGCIGSEPLTSLLARLRDDNVVVLIRSFGPSFFASRLTSDVKAMLRGRYPTGDICSLCNDLMSKPEVVNQIKAIANSPEGMQLAEISRKLLD